ncbi:MAG: 2-C-methyl-D-erythritol 4-phosphate cytidylyltransferase [Elusimicrobia bacterium]|nr:2-C-methyl-D-erythritol 4-phosphate cytidylyltransferase [Elusimicrobiota bacterium]
MKEEDLFDVLVMAAGKGQRYGGRKQFLGLGGTTLLGSSVELFRGFDMIRNIIVVYPDDMDEKEVLEKGKVTGAVTCVMGAEKREDSVLNGLREAVSEYVLIHDAARPVCTRRFVADLAQTVREFGSAVPGINPSSTVRYDEGGKTVILDRKRVYLVQTPQGYRTSEIREAYMRRKDREYTDSSSVMQDAGREVKIVPGDPMNIKVTYPEDYEYVKLIYGKRRYKL